MLVSGVRSNPCFQRSSSAEGKPVCRAVLTLCVSTSTAAQRHMGSLVQGRPEPSGPRTRSPHPPQPGQQLQANYSSFFVWVVMLSINFLLGL